MGNNRRQTREWASGERDLGVVNFGFKASTENVSGELKPSPLVVGEWQLSNPC